MQEVFTVTELGQLHMVSDPVRIRVLQECGKAPRTTHQLAAVLGMSYSKMHHHVDLLADAGLLVVVRTVPSRGTVERYFESAARRFVVSENLLKFGESEESDTAGEGVNQPRNLLQRDGDGGARPETPRGVVEEILTRTREKLNASVSAGLVTAEQLQVEGKLAQTSVRTSARDIAELETMLKQWLDCVRISERADGDTAYGVTVCFFPLAR